jgi:hypothetical protein
VHEKLAPNLAGGVAMRIALVNLIVVVWELQINPATMNREAVSKGRSEQNATCMQEENKNKLIEMIWSIRMTT